MYVPDINDALIKSSHATKFYSYLIIFSIISLSLIFVCSIHYNIFESFSFETVVIYLLITDFKYLTTLILHSMTSKNQGDLSEKIQIGMLLMTPVRFAISFIDSLAIGLGVFSTSNILKILATNGCISILINLFVFILFMPIFLALLLKHPTEDIKRSSNHFMLLPMANWYISRRKNYLNSHENYSSYCQTENQSIVMKMTLKAQVLLFFNLLTLEPLQNFYLTISDSLPENVAVLINSLLNLRTVFQNFVIFLENC